jgi:hypothetical protein
MIDDAKLSAVGANHRHVIANLAGIDVHHSAFPFVGPLRRAVRPLPLNDAAEPVPP